MRTSKLIHAYLEQICNTYLDIYLHKNLTTKKIKNSGLDQMFVPLKFVSEVECSNVKKILAFVQYRDLRSGLQFGKQTQDQDFTELFKGSSKLIIFGFAGAGKTTLIQWITITCAKACLGKVLTFEQNKFIQSSFGGKPLIPLPVSLGTYYDYCRQKECLPSSKTLWRFITHGFRSHQFPVDFEIKPLNWHLLKRCILMFDGLDDVPKEHRKRICRAIQDLVGHFKSRSLPCLITSQSPTTDGLKEMIGFQYCEIQPISPGQRTKFIELFCLAVSSNSSEAISRAKDISTRLKKCKPRVYEIATTPFMVMLLTIVYHYKKGSYRGQAQLYDDIVKIFLTRLRFSGRDLVQNKQHGYLKWRRRRSYLAFIAYIFQDRDINTMFEEELIELIKNRFDKSGDRKFDIIINFLKTEINGGGFLYKYQNRYGFSVHKNIQNFLVSCYLVEECSPQNLSEIIAEHFENNQWEEIIRLALGLVAKRNPNRVNRYMNQLAMMGIDDDAQSRALRLAGLALSDIAKVHRPVYASKKIAANIFTLFSKNPPKVNNRLRNQLGLILGKICNPQTDPLKPEMVFIPAGNFQMGCNPKEVKYLMERKVNIWKTETPAHSVSLSEYLIGKYPITNSEYCAFLDDKGYEKEKYWSFDGWQWRIGLRKPELSVYSENVRDSIRLWLENRPVELRSMPFWWENVFWNAPTLPVIGVSWFEVEAYCNWLGSMTNRKYRLPTEAEWERGARGSKNYLWPWGNNWRPQQCNNIEPIDKIKRTTPVGMYPHGTYNEGPQEMVGNVWEWCSDWWKSDIYQTRSKQKIINPLGPNLGLARVLRGGSWSNLRNRARNTHRYGDIPDYFGTFVGFRLALSVIESHSEIQDIKGS